MERVEQVYSTKYLSPIRLEIFYRATTSVLCWISVPSALEPLL